MADPLDNTANNINNINQETRYLIDAVTSLSEKIKMAFEEVVEGMEGSVTGMDRILKQYERDFVSANKRVVTSLDKQFELTAKINKGQNVSKDIEKERQRLAAQKLTIDARLNTLAEVNAEKAEELRKEYEEQVKLAEKNLDFIEKQNNERIAAKGISGNLLENAKSYLDKIDKSGAASAVLSKNLNLTSKVALVAEAALIGVVNGMMRASDLINNFQKGLGVSYSTARNMQLEMAATAANSEKLFVTSEKLNKSFLDLSEQTGLVADFGGETLITMTALTDRLGMGAKEAGNLALLARTQGKNTETVLENTVATVSALNKQNGVAISSRQILNDIATTSKAITVSLGMNPELLAEAATEARLLGTNLSQVDAIADSLLDFESSISNELEAELLLGQQINLEKARQAALNNDLATLSKEIANNEAIMNSFANNNRIAQEAAAKALGMSREDLAGMVYQQEILRLGAEGFKDAYGEQAYEQMQSLSAQEKFAATLEKIQGIITDIGTILAPIIDGFASVVGYLAESKVFAVGLGTILTGLAISSVVKAVAGIYGAFSFLGPFAIPAAAIAVAGMMSQIDSAKQSVQDGIADSARGPFTITDAYGKMAVTAKGDNLVATPNVDTRPSSVDMSETNRLLTGLLNKNTNFSIGPQHLGTGMNLYTYNV